MSIQDEYKDLEDRLRQSKPQTEPLPPAFKRQVRHDLMEQMTMNDNRFSFRKLSMALGGLILLIGIPVFFWLAQMSIGAANNPGAASNPEQGLDPSRPTPTVAAGGFEEESEASVVEQAVDRAWFVSSEPVEGETAGLHDTINVTVGYELVTVQEAELLVKLVDGQLGLLTAGKIVSGTSGIVVIPLSLAELEDGGEGNPLQLQLLLRDPTPGVTRLLYLEFVEGWTMAAAEQTTATAEIVHISKPSPVEVEGVPASSTYEVELVTTYILAGYKDAVLVVGYEFTDENGSGGGYEVNAISAGSGTVPVTVWLDGSFLNAEGEPVEGVRFFARINRYDEALAQWANLFPGNEPLLDSELSLPYPFQSQETQLESGSEIWIAASDVVTRTTANGVAADITLVIGYNLSSEYESGEITFSSKYQATTVNGDGSTSNGGGGGGSEVAPGVGTMEFTFGFETASWTTAREWLDSMSTSLLLFGNTTSGDKVLVAEMTKIGIE